MFYERKGLAILATISNREVFCTRCICSTRISGINFDSEGLCNFCIQVDSLKDEYGTGGPKGLDTWKGIVSQISKSGRGRKYDCVIGVSGGTDSSYLLLLAKKWGLRPLAVHYDNTWNTAQAAENIRLVTDALGIDLVTYVVDNKEVDDIKLSFMRAGVREFDNDTDIAFVQVLRSTAAKFRVSYILEGHSFMAEGLSPVGQNYLDGGYVRDVHKRFGENGMRTLPNLTFFRFLKWSIVYRQKFIRPLWYLEYSKEAAKSELFRSTGWRDYGGHHLENRASAFAHQIYLPQRFDIDYRFLAIAAKVRTGLITREQGLLELDEPLKPDLFLVRYVMERLGLDSEEYEAIMDGPKRSFRDFRTYKRWFELMRPLFFVLAKLNRVPYSFYVKYCFPIESTTK